MILEVEGSELEIKDNHVVDMKKYLLEKLEDLPDELPTMDIVDHAEANRIMPQGTPRPGPLDVKKYTPYLVEPMNDLSPTTGIRRVVIMKGAQLGFTMMAECVIAYWMGYSPADILMVSATQGLLERWAARRLEPMIDSYGLRKKIYAQETNTKSRRSGDKTFSKEYSGCRLDMASAQSASSLRSTDKRILIRDEMDGAPAELTTGEGSWVDVSEARTNFWGDRKKILDFSTPTTFEASMINKAYQEGDQRKFIVPCPECKGEQDLEFVFDRKEKGIRPIYSEDGELVDAVYICKHCQHEIKNHQKQEIMQSGRWVPTAKCKDGMRSYYINSLYAPIGSLTFRDIYEKYDKAKRMPEDSMRSFVNLYGGLPFKTTGSRPKLQNVIELRGGYLRGTVENGVLFLTAGIDVQRGSEKDPNNPPRIEMEILGHGKGHKTWSIDYRRFEGAIDDISGGAWEELNKYAKETMLAYKRSDGRQFGISLIFIDSGDGMNTDVVYSFCKTWGNTFPIKGFNALRKKKTEEGDTAGPNNFKRYRRVVIGSDVTLYEISTNYYKTKLYNNLKIIRNDTGDQRPGFCCFPVDYEEKYFKMLTAEERKSDGSFHAGGRRNEALDTRVYADCAGDVFLDSRVLDYRAAAKKAGATDTQLQEIDHKFVLDQLENKTSNVLT